MAKAKKKKQGKKTVIKKKIQKFKVFGPYEIKAVKKTKGSLITEDSLKIFWDSVGSISHSRGIYVFGIRAAKGSVPWYVGMTTRTFQAECSHSAKLMIYNEVYAEIGKGTPIMYFVAQDTTGRGIPNNKILREVEDYFIEVALSKNPKLKNKQGTTGQQWQIEGVIRANQGPPPVPARKFRDFLGLQK